MPTDWRVEQSLSKTWPLWLSMPGKPSGSWSQAPAGPASRPPCCLPGMQCTSQEPKCSQPAQSLSGGIKLPTNYLNSSCVDGVLIHFISLGQRTAKVSERGTGGNGEREHTAQEGHSGWPGSWCWSWQQLPRGTAALGRGNLDPVTLATRFPGYGRQAVQEEQQYQG